MWDIKSKFIYICYCIFGKHLPQSSKIPICKTVRNFFARKILDYAGKNINVEKGAYFTPGVSIGDNSGIGINCELTATNKTKNGKGRIIIGNDVMMGPECVIYTTQHKYKDLSIPMRLQGHTESESVIIGDDVWIGRRVIIMPGVTVGKGSVIGAAAVVTKSIPEYSVAAGVPAKVIKNRG